MLEFGCELWANDMNVNRLAFRRGAQAGRNQRVVEAVQPPLKNSRYQIIPCYTIRKNINIIYQEQSICERQNTYVVFVSQLPAINHTQHSEQPNSVNRDSQSPLQYLSVPGTKWSVCIIVSSLRVPQCRRDYRPSVQRAQGVALCTGVKIVQPLEPGVLYHKGSWFPIHTLCSAGMLVLFSNGTPCHDSRSLELHWRCFTSPTPARAKSTLYSI